MHSFLKISLLMVLLMACVAGCTTSNFITADNFYRGIYDISTQSQALKDGYPSSGLDQDIPSYEEYKAGLKY
jgi:outer membrane protein assembly factor BamE (lipoprotein component of BamABCDE complex)